MMAISPHNFGSTGQKDNIFHFLRGLSDVDYGDLWEPELPYYFFAELLTTQEFHKDISNIISDAIPDCLRTCRALEIDIGPPNGANFGRMLIESFVIFFSCPNTRGYFGSGHDDSVAFLSNIYARAIGIFDASVTRAPGYESLQMSQNIPVAYSASELWLQVHEGWNSRLLGHQRSSSNWVFYHGFYVDPRLVFSLRFLEHVISTGIKQRPDCIFDSDCNRTTLDWLMNVRYEGVLALLLDDILVEHGIDPEWALAENERRKRVVTGDTSAHEVNIGVDVSKIQEVTKRRAFRSTEDD
jgi:hypothetical protein